MRRVALEIARERAVLLRLDDLVVGEREVVHSDVDVTRRDEALDARDEDRELLGALRQVRREDALRALEPRDVGVRVHRDAVGRSERICSTLFSKPARVWPGRP